MGKSCGQSDDIAALAAIGLRAIEGQRRSAATRRKNRDIEKRKWLKVTIQVLFEHTSRGQDMSISRLARLVAKRIDSESKLTELELIKLADSKRRWIKEFLSDGKIIGIKGLFPAIDRHDSSTKSKPGSL